MDSYVKGKVSIIEQKFKIKMMAFGESTVVERSPHNPWIKGLSPATAAGTSGSNKLECYIAQGWKGLPVTKTLDYWAHL